MYKMSHEQQVQMDKELLISAASYAKCLNSALNDALATQNGNLLLVEEEDDTKQTTFFYEKASYVRAGVLELAQQVTGKDNLATYEEFAEDLITFESCVSDELPEGWSFMYGDNDDCIAVKHEHVERGAVLC